MRSAQCLSGVVNEAERDEGGVEGGRGCTSGGKGQLAAGFGGGVTLCGMWSDSDHLC